METGIVSKKAFGDDSFERLDAEYVRPSFVQAETAIDGLGGQPLAQLVQGYAGPALDDTYRDEGSIMSYVDIDAIDVSDGLIFGDSLRYADRPGRAKWVLKEDDILVSNVRPNRGAVGLVSPRTAGAVASSGFTLLRASSSNEVPWEFCYVFLRSAFGRAQLIRRDRGSMYPAVLPRDVMSVRIPIPTPEVADVTRRYVREAQRLQDDFFEAQAEQDGVLDRMISDYGAPPSPLESARNDVDSTVINRSSCFGDQSAERMDAEFFRREYEDFHAGIDRLGAWFRLGDHFDLFAGRLSKGNSLVPTIKQAVLTNSGINWGAVVNEPGNSALAMSVKPGDLLLAATAHEIYYVGRKVDYVREVPTEYARNQAVADLMILRPLGSHPSHISGSYVAAFLRNPAGRHQVQRCIRGLRGGHVYPNDLAQYVLLPEPDPKSSDAIEDLSRLAEGRRRVAQAAMDSAVSEVEGWLGRYAPRPVWT